jgi:hypothetical protein
MQQDEFYKDKSQALLLKSAVPEMLSDHFTGLQFHVMTDE